MLRGGALDLGWSGAELEACPQAVAASNGPSANRCQGHGADSHGVLLKIARTGTAGLDIHTQSESPTTHIAVVEFALSAVGLRAIPTGLEPVHWP